MGIIKGKKRLSMVAVIVIAGFFLMQEKVNAIEAAKPGIKPPPAIRSNIKLLKRHVLEKNEKVFILNNGEVLSNLMSDQYEIMSPREIAGPDLKASISMSQALKKYSRKPAFSDYRPDLSMIEEGINKPLKWEVIDISSDGEYISLRFFKERDGAPPCQQPCPLEQYVTKYAIVRSDGDVVWSTKYEVRYEDESMFLFSPAKNLIVDYGLYKGLALYNMKGEKIGYVGGGNIAFSENGEYVLVVHDSSGIKLKDTLALFTSNAGRLWATTIREENPARFRKSPTAYIFSMAISPDGEVIAAATDMYTYLFNNKGEMLTQLTCHRCKDISFWGNQRALIVNGRAILYDLANSKKIWEAHPSKYGLTGKSYKVGDITSDGKYFALGCFNKRLQRDGKMAGKNCAMILDEQRRLKWRVLLDERGVQDIRFVDNDTKLIVKAGANIYTFDVSEVVVGEQ